MRNGNLFLQEFGVFEIFVLILPMRNGNQLTSIAVKEVNLGSYPTYEEWKRSKTLLTELGYDFGSYPTYEEWKP